MDKPFEFSLHIDPQELNPLLEAFEVPEKDLAVILQNLSKVISKSVEENLQELLLEAIANYQVQTPADLSKYPIFRISKMGGSKFQISWDTQPAPARACIVDEWDIAFRIGIEHGGRINSAASVVRS